MALIQEKIHTVDDIYSLPEGKRAELIDSQIYYHTLVPSACYFMASKKDSNVSLLRYLRRHSNGSFFLSDTRTKYHDAYWLTNKG